MIVMGTKMEESACGKLPLRGMLQANVGQLCPVTDGASRSDMLCINRQECDNGMQRSYSKQIEEGVLRWCGHLKEKRIKMMVRIPAINIRET